MPYIPTKRNLCFSKQKLVEDLLLYFRHLIIFEHSVTAFWANTDSGCEGCHFPYKLESQLTDLPPHLRILIGFIKSLIQSGVGKEGPVASQPVFPIKIALHLCCAICFLPLFYTIIIKSVVLTKGLKCST